jgi:hypothetical protein
VLRAQSLFVRVRHELVTRIVSPAIGPGALANARRDADEHRALVAAIDALERRIARREALPAA